MSKDNIKTGIMSAIKSQPDSHIRWSKDTKVSETTESPSSSFWRDSTSRLYSHSSSAS